MNLMPPDKHQKETELALKPLKPSKQKRKDKKNPLPNQQ